MLLLPPAARLMSRPKELDEMIVLCRWWLGQGLRPVYAELSPAFAARSTRIHFYSDNSQVIILNLSGQIFRFILIYLINTHF